MRIAHLALACSIALFGGCDSGADTETPGQEPTAEAGMAPAVAPDSEDGKTIYAIGLAVAQQSVGPLTPGFTEAEKQQLVKGMNDQLAGNPQAQLQLLGPRINPFMQRRNQAVQAAAGGEVTIAAEAGDDTLAYALGLGICQQSVAPMSEIFNLEELQIIAKGFADQVTDGAEVDLEVYGPKINELIQRRVAVKAETAKAAGIQFAEMAAGEENARVTPTGLVYREMVAGTGASPTAESKVTVHYRGALIDGTVFDSSFERGEPLSNYPLNQLIPGWIEGIQLMKVGGKARLTIPSDLAYGDMGSPPTIPGGATLVFEVELLAVE